MKAEVRIGESRQKEEAIEKTLCAEAEEIKPPSAQEFQQSPPYGTWNVIRGLKAAP